MAHVNSTGNGTRISTVSIRNVPGFTVRLDEHLRSRLESAAENHRHSLQKEIVARLEQSFQQESCDPPPPYGVTTQARFYVHE